jgi:hypothetical protein
MKNAIAATIIAASFAAPAFAADKVPTTLPLIHVPAEAATPAIPPADLLSRADRAAAADRGVSAGMQTLISEFVSASIRLAAIESAGEVETVGTAAQDRSKALVALAFHEPVTLTELSMKTAALIEFSEDMARLAEVSK